MRLVLDRCEIRPWRDADAEALARHANEREIWLKDGVLLDQWRYACVRDDDP